MRQFAHKVIRYIILTSQHSKERFNPSKDAKASCIGLRDRLERVAPDEKGSDYNENYEHHCQNALSLHIKNTSH
jgi:hypothetical protein